MKKFLFFLIICSFVLSSCGYQFSIIPDNMNYLDDFTTGDRSDIWQINGGSVVNNQLSMTGLINSNTHVETLNTRTSNKLFTSEDIKVLISVKPYCESISGSGATWQYSGAGKHSIYFGNVIIDVPVESQNGQPLGSRIACIWSPQWHTIEIKRYDDTDLTKFVVLIDGIEIQTGINNVATPLIIKGQVLVQYVKFQPYYSCQYNTATEVVARDKIAQGSIITTNSLKYVPTKFCPQDLGVLIIGDTGLTQQKGTITQNLASGQTLTVPAGQTWYIYYITKYVSDMKERCEMGQAYDTNTQTCMQTNYQQTPTNTLLYCKQDTDCVLPSKCNDATVKCVSNQCNYQSVVCTPDQIINYVQVIKTVEVTQPSINVIVQQPTDVVFTNSVELAGHTFAITSLPTVMSGSQNCQVARGQYLSPAIPGCYREHIDWGDYSFEVYNNIPYQINPYINVTFTLEGTGVYNGGGKTIKFNDGTHCVSLDNQDLDYDWVDTCQPINKVFKVSFNNVLSVNIDSYKEKVMLDSSNSVPLRITNNIFDIPTGNLNVKISKGLLDNYLPSQSISTNLKSGVNTVNLNLPTDNIGSYTVEVVPSFKLLNSQNYYSNNKLTFGYYVSNDPEVLNCKNNGCTVGTCQTDGTCLVTQSSVNINNSIRDTILGVFGLFCIFIACVVIIVLIILIVKRKR